MKEIKYNKKLSQEQRDGYHNISMTDEERQNGLYSLTETNGYKAWLCDMLQSTSLFREYNLTIAYDVPIWKIAYMCNDGKYQSFDEMLEEDCPDKKKKFDLVICRECEVLVVISFDTTIAKSTSIRLPLLSFKVNNVREETVKMIVGWVTNKLSAGEENKYLYCPERNRKIRRMPLKSWLNMLEREYANLERGYM